MTRMVHCKKLGQELPGLEYAPLPGPVGQRLYQEISAEAWDQWVKHQTMVINEYRLNPSDPEAQKTLLRHLEDFFWGQGVQAPPDYVPPKPGEPGHDAGAGG